jgi:Ca2+-binding RTX toxin-like protein
MVVMIRHDLEFILDQILISEAHADGADLASLLPNPFLPWGVRTVDGSYNNLLAGQEQFGAADNPFPRALDPHFLNLEPNPLNLAEGDTMPLGPLPAPVIINNNYGLPGSVADANPRIISNLISDQTITNDAAVDAAGGLFFDPQGNAIIPNVAPDEGLSAPFNSWMTLFGQFFDHGLDLVTKGGNGTVYIPLQPDDPLYVDGSPTNFMALTRATPVLVDGEIQHINTTTSWIDQNQTYTSHASHQVFLREYEFDLDGKAVANGHLLEGAAGGLANWNEVKAQALEKLGIKLSDFDIGNVPLLLTDQYGKFIPGANGYAQVVVSVFEKVGTTTIEHPAYVVEGTAEGLDINNLPLPDGFVLSPGATSAMASVSRTGHAFLDDIAHHAAPGFVDHDHNPLTPKIKQEADSLAGTGDDNNPLTYDDELLGEHFITGDGRGNENIGLTAVHYIFHAEHNRLVEHVKEVVLATGDAAFIEKWQLPDGSWNGERLFQAARFGTEMQYQHLVFEEFARKVQPMVNLFGPYDATIDPSIVAEFAHVVYRFGHSMLTETIDRYDASFTTPDHIGLIEGFLNPVEFTEGGTIDQGEAAGAIVRGMTRQVGNEIDEFIVEALRNNLLGLPLDLGALNLARGRETGVPTLNEARRQFFEGTGDTQLKPYENWVDFALNAKNELSVVNFIAAYGKHAELQAADVDTLQEKRDVAWALVTGNLAIINEGTPEQRTFTPGEQDRLDFLNSQGIYKNADGGITVTGVDDIDFWIGGLAEAKMPFGGMLGSTFNFVFETQMEALQDADRFYYLSRTAGLNFKTELEGSSFASLIMTHTDATHLPGDVFSTPRYILEVNQANQFNEGEASNGSADPTGGSIFSQLVSRNNPATPGLDGNYLRFNGGDHVVLGGTEGNDILIGGLGDDTLWGDGGKDRLEGGIGNDILNGGDGDDIITDSFGDDNLKGGNGNDVIQAGAGFDLILAGDGNDFVIGGEDPDETFGGNGDDFISAGEDTSIVFGGAGDDWIEGGAGNDLLQGENGDPFLASTIIGNDVIIGQGGNDDYDAESGDDIMVIGAGIDRAEGQLGFDWAIYKDETAGIEADMTVRAFNGPPLPGSPNAFLDRFDLTEGLSGTAFSDILRGDDSDAASLVGNELTNFTLINGLKDGLNPLFGAEVTQFNGGNIILGGDGSDIIEGRGGNDIIDGDAWLNVRLSIRSAADDSIELFSADSMSEFQSRMLSGEINPSQIRIVREILRGPDADFDTAVFSGNLVDALTGNLLYTIEGGTGIDLNGDGYISVSHDDPILGVGQGADGVDLLRGIERLQFADTTVILSGDNAGPEGLLQIADPTPGLDINGLPIVTPREDDQDPDAAGIQFLTVSALGITDADNITVDNPTGAVTGPVAFYWQAEVEPGSGEFVDLEREFLGEIVKVTGTTFTPGDSEVGLALRVRGVYQDAKGVIETVFSAVTAPVENVNDAPVGTVLISDMTPAEDALLVATNAFTDADGLNGVAFTYVWEASADGVDGWTEVGDGSATFSPPQSTVGQFLRVTVNYVDGNGTAESITSAVTTAAVTNTNDLATGIVAFDVADATQGVTITASLEGVADEDGLPPGGPVYSYQWFQSVDSLAFTPIVGATAAAFTPGQDQVDKFLKLVVTFVDGTGVTETLQSSITAPVLNVNDAPTGAPTLDIVAPLEGDVIAADTIDIQDVDGIASPITFQWQQSDGLGGWTNIAGATFSTFEPGQAQVGAEVRVVATYTDGFGAVEAVPSAPTAAVQNVNDAPIGTLDLSSLQAISGRALNATPNFTDEDGFAPEDLVYEWQTSVDGELPWTPIAGATAASFTPGEAEVGLFVRSVVTYADAFGSLETVVSEATGQVIENAAPSGSLIISDTTPTETFGISVADTVDDADGIVGAKVLQWESSVDGSVWAPIDGATTTTFTPTQDHVNLMLRVVVTYTDGLGIDERFESAPTTVVGDFNLGTVAADTITGTEGQDFLGGGLGNDTINAGGEDDTIQFTLGEEIDTIDGGAGNDTLNAFGTAAANIMRVLVAGDTILSMSGGNVTGVENVNLDLGDGIDLLSYNPASPPVTSQNVTVNLALGQATGFASIAGVEQVQGGSGDDTFIGNAENNTFSGGAGRDTYSLAGTTAAATITTGSATSAQAGTDTLTSIENYIGGSGNDSIIVNGSVNVIDGGDGNDTINAGGANDTVFGGNGNDTIIYAIGGGADTVDGGADTDTLSIIGSTPPNAITVTFNGTAISAVSGGAVSNVELFTIDLGADANDTLAYANASASVTVNLATGTASGFASMSGVDNVTGGNSGDTLIGNGAANTINGGGGADIITGGAGLDNLQGSTGTDTFIATIGDGNDTINGGAGIDTYDLSGTTAGATITTTSAISADIGTDTHSQIENIIGSQGNDTITLNGNANVIDGQGGNDTINAGGDADTVIGGLGNDILNGDGGNDTITGGDGNDSLNGGLGNDTFMFALGFDADTITGFDANPAGGGQDRLFLESSLGVSLANFNTAVAISSSGVGGVNTLITIGADTITLLNVNSATVDQTDFLFGP